MLSKARKQPPQRLTDLTAGQQRRAIAGSIVYVVCVTAALSALHMWAPVNADEGLHPAAGLVFVLAAFTGFIAYTVRRIHRDGLPEIRAVESLTLSAVWLVYAFSSLYLSMSVLTSGSFNEQLSPVSSLYFTVSVFTTVGFGDIHPDTDLARGIVTVQMVLGFILIGVGARILFAVGRRAAGSSGPGETS